MARAVAVVVLLELLCFASIAVAAPRGIRLTHSDDPSTSIAVSWNSGSVDDSKVFFGTAPSALDNTVSAQEIVAMGAPLGTSFTAKLSGLEPGTTYYYRVGSEGSLNPAQVEDPLTFTTISTDPCEPLTFVLVGDNRADQDGVGASPRWTEILEETLAHDPRFYVNTGDLVKNGKAPEEWSGFIEQSQNGLSLVPSLLAIGNHDNMDDNGPGAYFSQLFGLPTNSVNDWENYYSIDAGPIHIVALDSNARGTEFDEMVAWLADDLESTEQPWKMVFFHHAIYSRGNHSTGEEDDGLLNAALIPIFDSANVDFVLNGHSHNYERYAPSVGVDEDFGGNGRSLPAGDGDANGPGSTLVDGHTATTYMVSGGAGAITTDPGIGIECIDAACTFCLGDFNLGGCPQDVLDLDRDATASYDGKHNFAVFHVTAQQIDVEVYTTDAGNSGSGGELIDQFSMPNSAGGLCGSDPGEGGGEPTPEESADAGTTPTPGPGPADPPTSAAGCACRAGGGDAAGPLALIVVLGLVAGRRRKQHS